MTTETIAPIETITLAELPALKQPLADGLYGGVITLPDGRNVAVVYLDKAKPPKRMNVDAARAWAKSIGAQLITRAIGSLIVSTLGDLLPQTWVWTEEDWAPDPSAFAWYCILTLGNVNHLSRSAEGGAVAVRLIPLIS
jgi:hypothetical protein